jgi:hypothetical protein
MSNNELKTSSFKWGQTYLLILLMFFFLNESMHNKLFLLVRVALLNKMFKKLNSRIKWKLLGGDSSFTLQDKMEGLMR